MKVTHVNNTEELKNTNTIKSDSIIENELLYSY